MINWPLFCLYWIKVDAVVIWNFFEFDLVNKGQNIWAMIDTIPRIVVKNGFQFQYQIQFKDVSLKEYQFSGYYEMNELKKIQKKLYYELLLSILILSIYFSSSSHFSEKENNTHIIKSPKGDFIISTSLLLVTLPYRGEIITYHICLVIVDQSYSSLD